ncbi:hypothetical protein R0135_01010 [Congregibacter variabilis]|uniref:Lipoprotein n=1 Tax=Congregibacter variabilis TaxID=3081200 RepID=A0ABZ0I3M2_9GAMM|nr:hypothetical protein R0135_01010 [Congregibacter sp. IMCC43200]
MISLRKGMTSSRSRRMLLPALVFFACASLSAAGGGAIAALCLVPAGLVIDAARGGDRKDPAKGVQDA